MIHILMGWSYLLVYSKIKSLIEKLSLRALTNPCQTFYEKNLILLKLNDYCVSSINLLARVNAFFPFPIWIQKAKSLNRTMFDLGICWWPVRGLSLRSKKTQAFSEPYLRNAESLYFQGFQRVLSKCCPKKLTEIIFLKRPSQHNVAWPFFVITNKYSF